MKSENASEQQNTPPSDGAAFYQWVMRHHTRGIALILRNCSDFSREDAEDVFGILLERLVKHGPSLLGKPSTQSLFRHLLRAKEYFRRKRDALKRGSQFEHVDMVEHAHCLSISNNFEFTKRIEHREMLKRLLNHLPALSKKEAVLLNSIIKLKDDKVPDLYDLMTRKERALYAPKKLTNSSETKSYVLREIHRTRSRFRNRLKEFGYPSI